VNHKRFISIKLSPDRLLGGLLRQGFDHPALVNPAMPAGVERVLQFATQGDQPGNAAINVRDVAAGDAVHLGARSVGLFAEREQFADCGHVETQFAGVTDEVQPTHGGAVIAALAALGAHRDRQ
jgi:hypothetical protein